MPERAVPGRNSLEGLIDVGSWLLRHVRKRCEADIGLAVCVTSPKNVPSCGVCRSARAYDNHHLQDE
jgi:hypothetical protein